MKALNNFIIERLHIGKNSSVKKYDYFPKNRNELDKIISDIIDEHKANTVDPDEKYAIDLNNIDVSNITDFSNLFSKNKLYLIRTLDINEWDMINAKDISYMFKDCDYLRELIIDRWDVSNIKFFDGLFSNCINLFKLDLSNWKPMSALSMKYMFNNCQSLETIGDNISWTIKQALNIKCMFNDCEKLKLDLKNVKFNKKADKTRYINNAPNIIEN